MNQDNAFLNFILALPVWVKAASLLAVLIFLIWPAISQYVMRTVIFVFQSVTRGIYLLFGWVILDFFHKKAVGKSADLNIRFTQFMEKLDSFFVRFKEKIRKSYTPRMSIISVLIYACLVLIFAAPDLLQVDSKALLSIPKQKYAAIEQQVFGVTDRLQVIETNVTLMETPTNEGLIIRWMVNGEFVTSCFKTKETADGVYALVKTQEGNKGWIKTQYLQAVDAAEQI